MKDKQIQQLFDNYSDTLEPQTHLAERARELLRDSSRPKTAPKRAMWKSVFAVCCFFAVLLVFGVVLHGVLFPGQGEPNRVVAYDVTAVRGKSVVRADVTDVLPLNAFDESASYEIVSEKYYAFYFKDSNELAYVRAILGISTPNGIVEVSLIAETKDFVRNDLRGYYNECIKNSNSVQFGAANTEKGEYVTSAFFEARNMHFYVAAQGNPTTSNDIDQIIRLFA